MIEQSVAQGFGPDNPEYIRCFRHEGEDCPRCDGSSYRPRSYCAECGAPSGKPSQSGKVLKGLRNRRGKDQPMYCMECHPELGGGFAVMAGLDNMGAA